jgi:hypothetical protein
MANRGLPAGTTTGSAVAVASGAAVASSGGAVGITIVGVSGGGTVAVATAWAAGTTVGGSASRQAARTKKTRIRTIPQQSKDRLMAQVLLHACNEQTGTPTGDKAR